MGTLRYPLQPGSRTRLYGLFGHPVTHSLSPRMQNAALRESGLDALYLAFDVEPSDLKAALQGARAMGVAGLNVTVPHKERALGFSREADPVASLIGAANTLVPADGGWRAYNTDAEGFLGAVRADLGFTPGGRRCLLLGAGGAARAAAVALAREGAQEIFVANRNGERAETLCADLGDKLTGTSLRAVPLDAAFSVLGAGDLLVSATPLGLQPDGSWPWDLGRLAAGVVVYDMAYRPTGETRLAEAARGAGLLSASGRSMLLGQGARAFSLWTGLTAPAGAMEQALATAGA